MTAVFLVRGEQAQVVVRFTRMSFSEKLSDREDLVSDLTIRDLDEEVLERVFLLARELITACAARRVASRKTGPHNGSSKNAEARVSTTPSIFDGVAMLVLHHGATIASDVDARGHESTNEVSRLQISRHQTQDSRITRGIMKFF